MSGSGTMARVIKGPQGGLSTPVAFNMSPICPTTPLVPQGCHVGLMPRLKKMNHSRRQFMIHLIMGSELCERATD
jgi:hypothetical protein